MRIQLGDDDLGVAGVARASIGAGPHEIQLLAQEPTPLGQHRLQEREERYLGEVEERRHD